MSAKKERRSASMEYYKVEYNSKDVKRTYTCICRYYIIYIAIAMYSSSFNIYTAIYNKYEKTFLTTILLENISIFNIDTSLKTNCQYFHQYFF